MYPTEALTARQTRRGGKLLLFSSAWAQGCALLRYVIVARLLGPQQLGLAAILIVTASFFDLISDVGGDRFLIQDHDGDEERVQALVQLVLVARGFAIAAVMAIFAWPFALFYKAPPLTLALIIFSLSPMISGFLHLDLRRTQRHHDFRLESICSSVSEAFGLVATVTAAFLTHDFTAVLWGIITRSLVSVICSHLLASRRYALRYSRRDAPRLFRFSLPLMINGLILFLGGQGDRVLVGRQIGFAGLGHYSAVLLLVYYPAAMIQRYVHAIYLPMIASARSARSQRANINDSLASQTLLISISMLMGFAVVAPPVIALLYGKRFTLSLFTVALIGILQSSRFLAVWPTTVALATGRSSIVLSNNLVRLIAWPAAIVGYMLSANLIGIVTGFTFGELLACAAAIIILNRFEKSSPLLGLGRFVVFIAAALITLGWAAAIVRPNLFLIALLSMLTAILFAFLVRSEFKTIQQAMFEVRRLVVRRQGAA